MLFSGVATFLPLLVALLTANAASRHRECSKRLLRLYHMSLYDHESQRFWKLTTSPWGEELRSRLSEKDNLGFSDEWHHKKGDYKVTAVRSDWFWWRQNRRVKRNGSQGYFKKQICHWFFKKRSAWKRSISQISGLLLLGKVWTACRWSMWHLTPPTPATSASHRCSFGSSELLGLCLDYKQWIVLLCRRVTWREFDGIDTHAYTQSYTSSWVPPTSFLLHRDLLPWHCSLQHTHRKKFNIPLSFSPFPHRGEGLVSAVRPLFHQGCLLMAY